MISEFKYRPPINHRLQGWVTRHRWLEADVHEAMSRAPSCKSDETAALHTTSAEWQSSRDCATLVCHLNQPAPHSSLPHVHTWLALVQSTPRLPACAPAPATWHMTHLLGMTETVLPSRAAFSGIHDVTLGSGRERDAPLSGPAMHFVRACVFLLGALPQWPPLSAWDSAQCLCNAVADSTPPPAVNYI